MTFDTIYRLQPFVLTIQQRDACLRSRKDSYRNNSNVPATKRTNPTTTSTIPGTLSLAMKIK
jgi:hypothetical protein